MTDATHVHLDFRGTIRYGSGFEQEISEDPFCALDYSETGNPTSVALAARILASHWHGGQASALYAFASSGHLDADACVYELSTLAPHDKRPETVDALIAFFTDLPVAEDAN